MVIIENNSCNYASACVICLSGENGHACHYLLITSIMPVLTLRLNLEDVFKNNQYSFIV